MHHLLIEYGRPQPSPTKPTNATRPVYQRIRLEPTTTNVSRSNRRVSGSSPLGGAKPQVISLWAHPSGREPRFTAWIRSVVPTRFSVADLTGCPVRVRVGWSSLRRADRKVDAPKAAS